LSSVFSQQVLFNSTNIEPISPCQGNYQYIQDFQFYPIGTVALHPDSAVINYDLFNGLTYDSSSVQVVNNTGGDPVVISEFDITNLNEPKFLVKTTTGNPLAFGQTITIRFRRSGDCSVSNLGSVATQDNVGVEFQGMNFSTVNSFDINDPSIVIQEPSVFNLDTVIRLNADTVCMPLQILNAGLGDLKNVTLTITNQEWTRNHSLTIGDTTIQFSAGTPSVTLDFSLFANNDTSFANVLSDSNLINGELLTVYHCFTVINCSRSNWERTFTASFGCNGSTCQTSLPITLTPPLDQIIDQSDFLDVVWNDPVTYNVCNDGSEEVLLQMKTFFGDTSSNGTQNPYDSVALRPRYRQFNGNTYFLDTLKFRAYYASDPSVTVYTFQDLISPFYRQNATPGCMPNTIQFASNDFYFNYNSIFVKRNDSLIIDFSFVRCPNNGQTDCTNDAYSFLETGQILTYVITDCSSTAYVSQRNNFLPRSDNRLVGAAVGSSSRSSVSDGGTTDFCYTWDVVHQTDGLQRIDGVTEVILPSGFTADTSGFTLTRNGSGNFADSVWLSPSGDTLRIFDLDVVNSSSTFTYSFCFTATLNCGSLPTGFVSSSFSYSTITTINGCSTPSVINHICDQPLSFFISCTPICPKGFIIDNQIVERKNFGYSDPDNDNWYNSSDRATRDSSGVRADRLMAGDTLCSSLSMGVETNGDTISAMIVNQQFDNGEFYNFVGGAFTVFDASTGSSFSGQISASHLTEITSADTVGNSQDGVWETYQFAIDASSFSPGFIFDDADSIQLELCWRMIPESNHFLATGGILDHTFITTIGQSTDNIATSVYMVTQLPIPDTTICAPGLGFNTITEVSSGFGVYPYGNDEFNTTPIPSTTYNHPFQGNLTMTLYSFVGNNTEDESVFPNEIRPVVKLDTVYFNPDSLVRFLGIHNIIGTVDSVTYWVERLIDHQGLATTVNRVFGEEEDSMRIKLPIMGPAANGLNYIVVPANVYKDAGGVISVPFENNMHRFKFHLSHKEECVYSAANISDYRFPIFANVGWDAMNIDSLGNYSSSDRDASLGGTNYSRPFMRGYFPRFSSLVSQSIVMNTKSKSFTTRYDIRHQTPYPFVFIEYDTANAEMNFLINVSTGDTLYFTEVANGAFVELDSILNGDVNLTFDYSLTSCETTPMIYTAGASERSIVDRDSLDFTSFCTRNDIRRITLEPTTSILQAEVFDEPRDTIKLCEEDTIGIRINSAGNSDILNPYILVPIKPGIIFNNISINYLNIVENVSWDTVGSGGNDSIRIWLANHSGINDSLPGTILQSDTLPRQVLVSISYGTTCDVVSGGTFKLVIYGNDACGGPSNGSGSVEETAPVNIITGASYNFIVLPSALPTAFNGCQDTIDYSVQFSMLPDTDPFAVSNGRDTFSLMLPSFVNYVLGSYVPNSPDFDSSQLIINVLTDALGNDSIIVSIPAGINLGEGFTLNFKLMSNRNGDCGVAETIRSVISGSSNSSSPTCFSPSGTFFCTEAIAIQRGQSSQTVTIEKSIITELDIKAFVRDSMLVGSDEIAFNGRFKVTNRELQQGDTLVLDIYCLDDSGNRIGAPIQSYKFLGQVAVDSIIEFSDSAIFLTCPGVSSIEGVIAKESFDGSTQCICDSTKSSVSFTLIQQIVAVIDMDTVNEDGIVTIDVIINDTLPDSNLASVTVSIPNQSSNGTSFVDSNGNIVYQPDSNFVGVDTLEYVVCDSSVLSSICDTSLVFITVFPQTDTLSLTINEDSDTVICLDSVTNLQGGIISSSICGGSNNGVLVSAGGNCYSYAPDSNYFGLDTICLIACNPSGFCDTTYFVITIDPINDNPTAINDTSSTVEDVSVVINVTNNDFDIDGIIDMGSVGVVSGPSNGSVVVNPTTGEITYTPSTNFVGTDMFSYVVCDTGIPVFCDTALVLIKITARADTTFIRTGQDSTITFCTDSLTNLMGGGPYFTSNCGSPANGSVTTSYSTCFNYTPNSGYYGSDTMCIITCNLSGFCDTTIVVITIDPKQPKTDTIITIDSVICVDTTEIPGGYTSISTCDGMNLTTNGGIVSYGVGSCINLNPIYTSFTDTTCIIICNSIYNICDTTIIISIRPPTPDTTVTVLPPSGSVTVCADTSELTSTMINYLSCRGASAGTFTRSSGNCFTYIPLLSQIDTTCVISCDDNGICDTSVFVFIPSLNTDSVITTEPVICLDTTEMPAGHQTITGCDGSSPASTSNGGTATIDPVTGCVTVTPDFTTSITDTTCIIVCDTVNGICDTTIIVSVNRPSIDTVVLPTNGNPTNHCISTNELIGSSLTYRSCGAPSYGVFANTDTCYNYIPVVNRIDTACAIVCDEFGICDTTVFIYVPPVTNDTVVTRDSVVCVDTNELIGATVDSISTCDGTPMTRNGGSVAIDATTGCVTISPDFSSGITDTTCVVVCKSVAGTVICDTTIIITVQPPTIDTIIQLTNGNPTNECLTQDELAGTMFTYSTCGNPIHGVLTVANDTCFTYTPINDRLDTSCVVICDEFGMCDTTVFIYVPPVTKDTIYTLDSTVCVDTTEMPASYQTVTGCDGNSPTTTSNGGTVSINANGCVTISPVFTSRTDTTCIVICDTVLGICDTTLIVSMRRATPDTIIECIPRDGMANDSAMNTMDLLGSVVTKSVFKLPKHGQFILTNDTNSSYQTSPFPVLDTVQVSFCDEYNFCDTFTFIYIPPMRPDTLYTQGGGVVCVDSTEMPRGAYTSIGTCDGMNMTSNGGTVAVLSGGCVDITPDFSTSRVDTTCVVLCDTVLPMCECDTTYIISFAPATTDTFAIQLPRGTNTADTCLTTEDLFGNSYTYRRLGAPAPHGPVTTHNDTCINYVQTSTTKYLDTARVLICDEYGNCDTTVIIYVPAPDPDTLLVGPVIPSSNADTCVRLEATFMTGHHVGTCDGTGTTSLGVPVTFTGLCVSYPVSAPIFTGDTACIIVCDTVRNIVVCDTTLIVYLPDTTPPTVVCKDDTVYLDNFGTVTIDTSNVVSSITDNTLINSVWVTPTNFNCTNVGLNSVTLYAVDTNRNIDSCVATITVLDTVPPIALCQNVTIQLDSNGNASISAIDLDAGSIDNCAIASLSISQTSFDCSHIGSNTVVLTVTDVNGNVSSCSATVTVQDNIAPIVYCPGNKEVVLRNTTCEFVVPDYRGEVSAWDNCLVNGITFTQSPGAGSIVNLENTDTVITITATDGINSSTCSFVLSARCVKELNIPQFISPNSDGKNDTWEIPELANYPSNVVKLFNRWGNLVFEQKGYSTGWNGRSNVDNGVNRLIDNKQLPEGTYYYIIDLGTPNSEPYVGYMQIKR
jgi:gliding motility-associated-like protein